MCGVGGWVGGGRAEEGGLCIFVWMCVLWGVGGKGIVIGGLTSLAHSLTASAL